MDKRSASTGEPRKCLVDAPAAYPPYGPQGDLILVLVFLRRFRLGGGFGIALGGALASASANGGSGRRTHAPLKQSGSNGYEAAAGQSELLDGG